MGVLATDEFNYGAGFLRFQSGSIWELVTSELELNIDASGAVVPDALPQDCAARYTNVVWPDDQYSQVVHVTITGTGDLAGMGPMVRCSATERTYYGVVCNAAGSNDTQVSKLVNDVGTLLSQFTLGWTAGDVMRIEVEGTTIRVKKNGVEVFGINDASVVSGQAGIRFSGTMTAAAVDNWEGGMVDPFEQGGTEPNIEGMTPHIGAL